MGVKMLFSFMDREYGRSSFSLYAELQAVPRAGDTVHIPCCGDMGYIRDETGDTAETSVVEHVAWDLEETDDRIHVVCGIEWDRGIAFTQ